MRQLERDAPLSSSSRILRVEVWVARLPQSPLQQVVQRLQKMRLVLRVDVLDSLETLDETLSSREKVAVHEEVVLPLVGTGVVEDGVDELEEGILVSQ